MIKTIERQNQKIKCGLTLSDGGINPKFTLRTNTKGNINYYEITAQVCGLNDCKESALYFIAHGVENINENKATNEDTLIDSAIIDIFEELTQQ